MGYRLEHGLAICKTSTPLTILFLWILNQYFLNKKIHIILSCQLLWNPVNLALPSQSTEMRLAILPSVFVIMSTTPYYILSKFPCLHIQFLWAFELVSCDQYQQRSFRLQTPRCYLIIIGYLIILGDIQVIVNSVIVLLYLPYSQIQMCDCDKPISLTIM